MQTERHTITSAVGCDIIGQRLTTHLDGLCYYLGCGRLWRNTRPLSQWVFLAHVNTQSISPALTMYAMVFEFCIAPKGRAECLFAQYMSSVTMGVPSSCRYTEHLRLQFFLRGSYSVPCVWVLSSDVSVRPRSKGSAI